MTATILQCDREAAAAMYDFVQSNLKAPRSPKLIEMTKREMLAGCWDKNEAVLAFARHRHDSMREMAEALELLRQAMNALGTVDNNDPLEPIADNGMTVWDGMRGESLRLWPHYRTFLATLQGADR